MVTGPPDSGRRAYIKTDRLTGGMRQIDAWTSDRGRVTLFVTPLGAWCQMLEI